jgi:predicted TIM-barrel fold metal-dependent hydrolase
LSDHPLHHPIVDAYCHIGLPRFGTAADAWQVLSQHQVDQAVFVLGPAVPAYAELFAAIIHFGDRVRAVGIPFGTTLAQIRESIELQLRAGVLGLRVQDHDLLDDAAILEKLGERGGWLYAINIIDKPAVLRRLLAWLEHYPNGRIAAPHFLSPEPLRNGSSHDDYKAALVSHPHFFPIFSRQGAVGSRWPYPHPDLRPWVEEVIALTSPERILWGSEYPVIFWRNESYSQCKHWLQVLDIQLEAADWAGYWGANAHKAIFAAPPPPAEAVTIPNWVDEQFNKARTVPLFQPNCLEMPMDLYAQLHHRYVQKLASEPAMSFGEFVLSLLRETTAAMDKAAPPD